MSKQIDFEKLRRLAEEANTPEQWYLYGDLTSCSYSYDKAFIAEFSPSVAMELLDRIAALEKDAARWNAATRNMELNDVCVVVYDNFGDGRTVTGEEADQAIDTAMEASNAKAD